MTDRSEKLLCVRHRVAEKGHIVLDNSKCTGCELKPCLYFCSAGCFTEKEGEVNFRYEGCLECGTCRVMCRTGALTWGYPLGGYGVSFRIG